MWEIWVQSLGQEDTLEREMATHSSILAWEILWMEEPGGLQSMGSQRVGHDWATKLVRSGLVQTMETVTDFIFLDSKITADSDCSHEIKRRLLLERKVMTNLDSILKSKRHYFANKVPSIQSYGFSSGHMWMLVIYRCLQLVCNETWMPKNWCFWTVVLEKTLESPLDCKEIQPVHPKGNQSWIFIGRTDAEAETPILWPPATKNWLIWKDPDAGKDWRQEEKGRTEDGWDGWMTSSTQWTWVWVSSGNWWWSERPGVLRSMGLQSQTRLSNWTELNWVMSVRRKIQSVIKTSKIPTCLFLPDRAYAFLFIFVGCHTPAVIITVTCLSLHGLFSGCCETLYYSW